jgi:hypothetical protein
VLVGILPGGRRHAFVQERQAHVREIYYCSSKDASLRFPALSLTHSATILPTRFGRVLPRMIAILSGSIFLLAL